jgi:hypothetical protein
MENAAHVGVDKETFSQWAWHMLEEISYLEVKVVRTSLCCCIWPLSYLG